MTPPKTRAVIFTDVLSVTASIFKYLWERTRFLLESLETLIGLAPWGLVHQGFVPFFLVSPSSLFSILFFKKGKEKKKTELEGRKEGKEVNLATCTYSETSILFLTSRMAFPITLFSELKGIWGVTEREKPWHCWQDTLQHLGCSSETCGQANLASLCWACKT